MSGGVEEAKRAAARQAVDEHVRDGMKVGVGSGSTIVYAVERLAERVSQGLSIRCVPTSFQARNLIIENGLVLSDLNIDPILDVAIDGADEVDQHLNLIKGGGGAHLQEKCVAFASKEFIVIADYRKDAVSLGTQWKKGVPTEVLSFAYVSVMNSLRGLGGIPTLRIAQNKAGPVVSDNGNFIVDVEFGMISDPESLNARLLAIPGLLETGLFCGMAKKAYFGQEDGTVTIRHS